MERTFTPSVNVNGFHYIFPLISSCVAIRLEFSLRSQNRSRQNTLQTYQLIAKISAARELFKKVSFDFNVRSRLN